VAQTTPTSFRLVPETLAQLDAVADHMGLHGRGRRTAVIELLVQEYCRKNLGAAAPPDAPKEERRGRPRKGE
jgi:hypothetical protein